MKLTTISTYIFAALLLFSCNTIKSQSDAKPKKNFSRTNVSVDGKRDSIASQAVEKGGSLSYVGINNIKRQLQGEWTILTINNKKISTRERAYINLDFKYNKLYGNNGCNVINGEFKADANKISFTDIISTMMSCHSVTSEKSVMKALKDASSFRLTEKNKITYLNLQNAKGNTIMTLRRQNLDFINGAWTVKEIEGAAIDDKNVRLVIDTEQLKIHGTTGCNVINGGIYIDNERNGAIQFQQLVSTRKMCEEIKTETSLLVALEETYFCKKISDTEIQLISDKNKVLVVLKRLNLKRNE